MYFQDTGISVRKRVIKIFRDICLEHTDFTKIPEMCVKMIRRVNDEEGIKVWKQYIYTFITVTGRNSAMMRDYWQHWHVRCCKMGGCVYRMYVCFSETGKWSVSEHVVFTNQQPRERYQQTPNKGAQHHGCCKYTPPLEFLASAFLGFELSMYICIYLNIHVCNDIFTGGSLSRYRIWILWTNVRKCKCINLLSPYYFKKWFNMCCIHKVHTCKVNGAVNLILFFNSSYLKKMRKGI